MKAFIGSLVLGIVLAGCSTYREDSAGAGGTGRHGDTYDYQGEASSHNSAL